ncbi:MAG: CHAT domain-containing protein [Algoriphagus sp.]|uniref:CHAT domain-containing protein n=1 Tax=Algoriphagus sp. TaxID=1872435 RepID=UPI002638F18E|nr:CHAT domain-containing protein [Algoriphagus sp.]MDG1278627.1 CHAT domain-containing protein [Algoriphagus sp.]
MKKADSLFYLASPTEKEDQLAIELYKKVLTQTPNSTQAAEFIKAAERLGVLLSVYSQNELAAQSYRKGIRLAADFQVSDTLTYSSHLYLGELLFSLNKLDSSALHLKEAEKIQSRIQIGLQPERLFNALGVYYFETGNYTQSISYFSRAESTLKDATGEYVKYARYSFLSNKASALYHLEKYDSAKTIYRNLLSWGINMNQIRINLANTLLEEGMPDEALDVLAKIQNADNQLLFSYLNLLAKGYFKQGNLVKAEETLNQIRDSILQNLTRKKDLQRGIYYNLRGELYRERGDFHKAMEFFQKAIVELHPSFQSLDLYENPEQSTLGMASFTLFETLVSKAEVAWRLYEKEPDQKWFELGLNTYLTAFDFANFISYNFDNDEARIFLGDQALQAYQKAIDKLHVIANRNSNFELMKQAFEWAEQSKAGALRLGAFFEKEKRKSGIPKAMLQEEDNFQFLLSRNYQKQFVSSDEEEQQQLQEEYIELQVKLSRLREGFNQYIPDFHDSERFSLANFQNQLDGKTASISLFQSEKEVLVFWVEEDFFDFNVIDLAKIDFRELERWRMSLQNPIRGKNYQTGDFIPLFSKMLFDPWLVRMKSRDQLIVIPHDQFNSIPFEILPIEQEYLIQRLAVLYQFSGALLQADQKKEWFSDSVLGFAPFEKESFQGFSKLPGSEKEVSRFGFKTYLDDQADLTTFLNEAPHYPFIHLATHAKAESQDYNSSFIAFHPEQEEFRLFSQELSFQPLDSVELVFLSACDTGSGQLNSSEGLISLARSFALAGANHLVTSLWLTENQVAVYLSEKFYEHLEDGETYAMALRLAKLDLLRDPQMSQFSDPGYWANFVVIGQPELISSGWKTKYVIIGLSLILFLLVIIVWKRSRSKVIK